MMVEKKSTMSLSGTHSFFLPLDTSSTLDFHLAFGVGAIGTNVAKHDVIDAAEDEKQGKIDVSGNVGLGMRLYFNDLMSMRIDYRQYFYAAEGGGISHPAEVTAGVSIWTQGPQ